MLRGEEGFQAKEIRKLIGWLVNEPRPDVIDLPYTLLIALAKPLKEALNRPITCTLQGEDLFLEGLKEPWRSECLYLIRANLQSHRPLYRRQRLLRRIHVRLSRNRPRPH